MRAVRVWLPVGIVLLGVAMIVVQPDISGLEAGAMTIGAGLAVWLLNLLYRVGVAGDRERDAEARAREHFERHGRWPDDPA